MAVNPILQAISGQNSNNPLSILLSLKNSNDPQKILQSMPQCRQTIDYINQNGGNPKTAFYNLASQRGINPNEILNKIR